MQVCKKKINQEAVVNFLQVCKTSTIQNCTRTIVQDKINIKDDSAVLSIYYSNVRILVILL